MKIILALFLGIILSAAYTPSAQAGNFCIGGAGLPLQCIYDDVETCARAAEPPTTSCVLNPEAKLHIYGQSDYCLIHSGGIGECLYVDRGQCNDDAERAKGICINRTTVGRESDPYIYDPRVQHY